VTTIRRSISSGNESVATVDGSAGLDDVDPSGLPSLIDIESVASSLGVGVRHVRRLVAEGRIPYFKVGHFVRFDPEELVQWLEQRHVMAGDREGMRRAL